jgi:hypothetical protein
MKSTTCKVVVPLCGELGLVRIGSVSHRDPDLSPPINVAVT